MTGAILQNFFKSQIIGLLLWICGVILPAGAASNEMTPRCVSELHGIIPRQSNRDLAWYLLNTQKGTESKNGVGNDIDNEVLQNFFAGRFDPNGPQVVPKRKQGVTHNFPRRWPQQLAWFRIFLKMRFEDPEKFAALSKCAIENNTTVFWKTLSRFFDDHSELSQHSNAYMSDRYAAWSGLLGQMSGGHGTAAILEAFTVSAGQKLPRELFDLNIP